LSDSDADEYDSQMIKLSLTSTRSFTSTLSNKFKIIDRKMLWIYLLYLLSSKSSTNCLKFIVNKLNLITISITN